MSEPRKNHLNIDGVQVKEEENVDSYKPIPDADAGFRSSKNNLSKSKEKVSADGAEEKLLPKEEEAKIVTRVDMADAKYVVGDHRNGDAKIELDANKRQFSGLTKEELLKFADDPFWVNLRWFLFILFWALWLSMLAGAIVIIVKAPKCSAPEPKTWFQKGPLVDMDAQSQDIEAVLAALPQLQSSAVQGVFLEVPSYEVLEDEAAIDTFKPFFAKAKELGIKVIVDLIPNFVSKSHRWFQLSENKTEGYTDYFLWKAGPKFNETEPNSWVSVYNQPAWSWSARRSEYYLHQYEEEQPDLNLRNSAVVKHFDDVLKRWIKFGAAGVRLQHVRQALVDPSFEAENPAKSPMADLSVVHTEYAFWDHSKTTDQPGLLDLLKGWALVVDQAATDAQLADHVFTIKEEPGVVELYLSKNMTMLRPASAAAVSVRADVPAAAAEINKKLGTWPALQLTGPDGSESEVALLSLLLPAAPVLTTHQVPEQDNTTVAVKSESLEHLASFRSKPSIEQGSWVVTAVPSKDHADHKLLAVARWKEGRDGYVGVFNPANEPQRANLTALPALPASLTVHHVSRAVKQYTNYSSTSAEAADNVLVPPLSTVLLHFAPQTSAEN